MVDGQLSVAPPMTRAAKSHRAPRRTCRFAPCRLLTRSRPRQLLLHCLVPLSGRGRFRQVPTGPESLHLPSLLSIGMVRVLWCLAKKDVMVTSRRRRE